MCDVMLLSSLCRECYSEPQAVYEQLKRAGMDLVTVTDHDSIGAAGSLRRYPDFFLSQEVTCRMPGGTEVHVGVYNIEEHHHVEIQRRRNDLPRLLAYLHEEDLFFTLNHPFSRLTGRRDVEDLGWFDRWFPAFEVVNGHIFEANNCLAREAAQLAGKHGTAGSDADTLLSLGSAYTEVSGARDREEFIAGLKRGKSRPCGDSGRYWKLTREVLSIAQACITERPLAWLLSPLILAIPFVTMSNSLLDLHFARRWRRRMEDLSIISRDGSIRPPAVSPEEVQA